MNKTRATTQSQLGTVLRAAAGSGGAIARPLEAAERAKSESDLTQAEKFAAAAREHGTDQDEEAFKGVLRKLAKGRAKP